MKIIWIFAAVMATSCVQKKKDSGNGGGANLPVQPIVSSGDLTPKANLEVFDQGTLAQEINRETNFQNPTRPTSSSSQPCAGIDNLMIESTTSYFKVAGVADNISNCISSGTSQFTGVASYKIAMAVACSPAKDFSQYNGNRVGALKNLVLDCPAGSTQYYLSNSIFEVNGTFVSQGKSQQINSKNIESYMTSSSTPCVRDYTTDRFNISDCVYTKIYNQITPPSSNSDTYTQITFQKVSGRLKTNSFDTGSVPFVFNDWRGTMNYSSANATWNAVNRNSSQASGTFMPSTSLVEIFQQVRLPWNF